MHRLEIEHMCMLTVDHFSVAGYYTSSVTVPIYDRAISTYKMLHSTRKRDPVLKCAT